MKIKKTFIILCCAFCFACTKETETVSATLQFTHTWDGQPITAADLNEFKFTTKKGTTLSIERYRYVISNLSLLNTNTYKLIDISSAEQHSIELTYIAEGNYTLSFTFGFRDIDNTDGIYKDLNSANFNVPQLLGGGYHYMQFDGKYINTAGNSANFNYHAIRAVNIADVNNIQFKDTSFEVNLGTVTLTDNAIITIEMNLAEWFKNPHLWDLNELNTVLMPNFEAQQLIQANGQSVFTLQK